MVTKYSPVINTKSYRTYACCTEDKNGNFVHVDDYSALQQRLDALADKLARSEDYSIGVDAERMEYIEKCNAMAAENAVLKSVLEPKEISDEIQDLFNDTVKLDGDSDGYHQWSWVDNPDEVIMAVMKAMPKPETPATDAYLNSVRAGGAMAARNHIRKALTAFHYEYHGVVAECADMAEMVAQRLCSGTHDTADKAD